MNQSERRELLKILSNKLSISEFKSLVFLVLDEQMGTNAYEKLGGENSNLDEVIINFIKYIETKKLLPSVLLELSEMIPTLRSSVLKLPFGNELETPIKGMNNNNFSNNFVKFANRQPELEKIVHFPISQYYFVDAPAGYGKTRLLQKNQ